MKAQKEKGAPGSSGTEVTGLGSSGERDPWGGAEWELGMRGRAVRPSLLGFRLIKPSERPGSRGSIRSGGGTHISLEYVMGRRMFRDQKWVRGPISAEWGVSAEWGETPGSESEKNTLDGPARVAAFARVRGGLLGLRMGFGFSQGPERGDIRQGLKSRGTDQGPAMTGFDIRWGRGLAALRSGLGEPTRKRSGVEAVDVGLKEVRG